MSLPVLTLFVPGTPIPKGSMKAFYVKAIGRAVVAHDNAKSKPWASVVKLAVANECQRTAWQCTHYPILLSLTFNMPRPKCHFGTGLLTADTLRNSAPVHHTTKPDLDKLVRLIGDAMKGVVYADDSQVVHIEARKTYYGCGTGVSIKVEMLKPSTP